MNKYKSGDILHSTTENVSIIILHFSGIYGTYTIRILDSLQPSYQINQSTIEDNNHWNTYSHCRTRLWRLLNG